MKRLLLVLAAALALSLAAPASTAAGSAPDLRPLPVGTDVDYQLGGAVDRPASVGIVVRDRTAEPAPGRYNVCYVNGFQTQPDAKRFWRERSGLLLQRGGLLVVDGQWGEWLFDVRTRAQRQRLARIVGRWIEGCAADGFDAVELDNLDSFTRSKRLMERRDNLAFARLLVRRAHRAGIAVGQKNLAGFDGTRVGFDFAVSEECARYDECGRYVDHYGDQVLMVEYRTRDFREACRDHGATHAVVRRDLALRPSYEPRFC